MMLGDVQPGYILGDLLKILKATKQGGDGICIKVRTSSNSKLKFPPKFIVIWGCGLNFNFGLDSLVFTGEWGDFLSKEVSENSDFVLIGCETCLQCYCEANQMWRSIYLTIKDQTNSTSVDFFQNSTNFGIFFHVFMKIHLYHYQFKEIIMPFHVNFFLILIWPYNQTLFFASIIIVQFFLTDNIRHEYFGKKNWIDFNQDFQI